jgi:hypothetical protein
MSPTAERPTYTLTVRINGTSENPWKRYGCKYNPFPQLGKSEFDRAERILAQLDGDPIHNEAEIRDRLRGFAGDSA